MNIERILKYKILDKILFTQCSFTKSKKLYEEFLLSIVNSSSYFLKKSNNKKYTPPISESQGESDCISDNYKLDFKLLISPSYMEGKSISTVRYTYFDEGIILIHPVNKEPAKKEVGLIHNQLSPIYRYDQIFDKTDIDNIKKCLKICKNLLLFLPYEFSFDCNHNLYNEKDINKILNNDLILKIVEFRNDYINDYDTYFVYLYNGYLIINKINMAEIQLVEKVNLKKNIIYNKFVYKQ